MLAGRKQRNPRSPKQRQSKASSHFVYILKCRDGSLYVGATNDLVKRVIEHNTTKKGAKYTRGRRPVSLVYNEELETLALARAREAEIKRMTREEKLELTRRTTE
jgi:putative endonuclease